MHPSSDTRAEDGTYGEAMSLRLWLCKSIDKKLDTLESRKIELRAMLDKNLRKLTVAESIQFGIHRGYDDEANWSRSNKAAKRSPRK